jgi:rhodanese-related sulfurtransferase
MTDSDLRPLTAPELLALRAEGLEVLDVRPGPEWAAGHLRGSVFIGMSPKFPAWVELLLDRRLPWAVITPPGQEEMTLRLLAELGFEDLRGYLEGGFAALAAHPEQVVRTERIDHAGLAAELDSAEPPVLIDVRETPEYHAGRIGKAPSLPLTELPARLDEVPAEGRVILQCQGGYRSLIAASLCERAGREGLVDMEGGFGAWAMAGRPIQPAD